MWTKGPIYLPSFSNSLIWWCPNTKHKTLIMSNNLESCKLVNYKRRNANKAIWSFYCSSKNESLVCVCGSFCCCTKLLQNDVKNSKKISASVIVYNVLKNSAVCTSILPLLCMLFPKKSICGLFGIYSGWKKKLLVLLGWCWWWLVYHVLKVSNPQHNLSNNMWC